MSNTETVRNIIDDDNSSTVALNTGVTFTGTFIDATLYDSVIVAVKTDQDGVLKVEFSPDGTNVDSSLTRYYRTANIEAPHRFTVTRKHVRVTFENNSGTNQTYLRLQTKLAITTQNLNAPLDSTLAQDFDAIPTRPSDYDTEVALGLRQNNTLWNKFGYNDDIDGAFETVWSEGGTFARLPTAQTLNIASTSANDTSAGTGVRSVVIYGVDANWNAQTESVTMNGTSNVTTSNTWLGVNRIAIFTCGSGETNAGKITATGSTSGTVQAAMPTGEGVTQQCIFFIPADSKFITKWLWLNAAKISGGGGNPTVTVKFQVYSAVNGAKQEVFRAAIDTNVANQLNISPNLPFPIGEKSMCYLEASTDTINTAVRARFSGELISDVDA